MKYLKIILVGLILCSCASQPKKIPGTDINEKVFELKPVVLQSTTMTFIEIDRQVNSLNKYIGSYPPRFTDEAEREVIYKKWLSLVSEAEAYNTANSNTEKALYLLSELYRQGHNMDVKGSDEKALKNLDSCLTKFQYSVPCNFSASYFYLSIGLDYLDKAEKSLLVLKQHYAPNLNDEVEAGYIFLYLYRQNAQMAKKQIDSFITYFPNSYRVAVFENIRENLGETIEWRGK